MTGYVGFETGGYLDKLETDFNIVTNYWKKGTGGAPGEDHEIDLVAVNEADKSIVIGECKRNPDKIKIKVLQEKASEILAHHKGWKHTFIPLSLRDIIL